MHPTMKKQGKKPERHRKNKKAIMWKCHPDCFLLQPFHGIEAVTEKEAREKFLSWTKEKNPYMFRYVSDGLKSGELYMLPVCEE